MTRTVQFTELEEAVHHIERSHGPWNVQIEVETRDRLDPGRLRAAAVRTAQTHPLAGAHRRPSTITDLAYEWEIPEAVESIPVSVTDEDLATAQRSFYTEPFDLTSDPPFRVLVVRGAGVDGGDRLLVCTSHVAADGVGSLRIARSLCAAYRGDDIDPGVDFEASRQRLASDGTDLLAEGLDVFEEGLGVLDHAAHYLGNSVDPPARVATESDSDADDWHFVHRRLDGGLTEQVVENRPAGVSVNDALLAALHLAIATWNDDHGERTGKVSTVMPINHRPEEWRYEGVGTFATSRCVTTHPRHRDVPAATAERIADQTDGLKRPEQAVAQHRLLQVLQPAGTVGVRRQVPELLRGSTDRLVDTAVLSNLGRIPDPPSLSDEDPGRVWFSPPCYGPGPIGVGVGVVTVGDAIHLVFRHRLAQFEPDAGERFADTFVEELETVVT